MLFFTVLLHKYIIETFSVGIFVWLISFIHMLSVVFDNLFDDDLCIDADWFKAAKINITTIVQTQSLRYF